MSLENGERAIVRDLCRDVIKEEQDSCKIGNENRQRIISLEKEGTEVNDNLKSIYEKLNEVSEKHSNQWLTVAGATILQLVAIVVGVVFLWVKG